MADNQIKKCSTSLKIEEMQIKVTKDHLSQYTGGPVTNVTGVLESNLAIAIKIDSTSQHPPKETVLYVQQEARSEVFTEIACISRGKFGNNPNAQQ